MAQQEHDTMRAGVENVITSQASFDHCVKGQIVYIVIMSPVSLVILLAELEVVRYFRSAQIYFWKKHYLEFEGLSKIMAYEAVFIEMPSGKTINGKENNILML